MPEGPSTAYLVDMDYRGWRATVMGLGHFGGGVAAARWLARRGARVTVTDLADREMLAGSLAELDGEPIEAFHLGGHREEDFRRADLVVVNPAVRPENSMLQVAVESSVRLTSEVELFLENCPARVIGVTGSNGKSTTVAMTAAILQADGRQTWLGGNIGRSLLARLDEMTPQDWVVLELSSFQLHHLGNGAPLPHVAVVTGCSPNHLDWHGDLRSYIAAKQRILSGQTADDLTVLNTTDTEVACWNGLVQGHRLPLIPPDELPPPAVPGRHNRGNAACAATATSAVGCPLAAIRNGLQSFAGLPQRLEHCGEVAGRHFFNDSTATTPESTVAALRSVELPLWLLAGGRDKGCDFSELVSVMARRARGAALFGETAERLRGFLAAEAPHFACTAVDTMEAALDWCWSRSRSGEAILFSPACASGIEFRNFRARGEHFVRLVRDLPSASDSSAGKPAG